MTDDVRLFGKPDDEWLQHDLATVYENWECDNDVDDPEARKPFTIVEWTAKPIGEFVQSEGRILEHIYDWLCDDDIVLDVHDDKIEKAFADPGVLRVFAAARGVLVRKLNATGWRNADKRIADHQITWDESGQPLVDGEPLYVKTEP